MSIFCIIDDKYVPLYRIMWVSAFACTIAARPTASARGEYESPPGARRDRVGR